LADGHSVEPSASREPIVEGDAPSEFTPSFEAVLGAACKGDGRAFEQLYKALNRRVAAFSRVRGADDPEGVVNAVFLQVFTGLGGFEGSEPQFKAWVFRIARNKLIDEARRRERRPEEVAPNDEAMAAIQASDDVEKEVVGRLRTDSVLSHLSALTSDQRDVLLLRIVSDLSIDTVAEILDKPPGAVKALQRRALRTLARRISREAVPP
jgi:RNA polymerase sigma factor (sigma-70 family)